MGHKGCKLKALEANLLADITVKVTMLVYSPVCLIACSGRVTLVKGSPLKSSCPSGLWLLRKNTDKCHRTNLNIWGVQRKQCFLKPFRKVLSITIDSNAIYTWTGKCAGYPLSVQPDWSVRDIKKGQMPIALAWVFVCVLNTNTFWGVWFSLHIHTGHLTNVGQGVYKQLNWAGMEQSDFIFHC